MDKPLQVVEGSGPQSREQVLADPGQGDEVQVVGSVSDDRGYDHENHGGGQVGAALGRHDAVNRVFDEPRYRHLGGGVQKHGCQADEGESPVGRHVAYHPHYDPVGVRAAGLALLRRRSSSQSVHVHRCCPFP